MEMLSSGQIARYRQEGYLSPLSALTACEAAQLREQIDAFGRRHGLYEAHILRNKAHLKMPSLLPVIHDPRIVSVAAALLGPDVLCWGSSVFIKEPGTPDLVAWHQDSYYWDMAPDDVCTIWLALIDSTMENGALRVIPGSHREPPLPHATSPEGSGNMLFTYEEIAVPVDDARVVTCLLRAGEVSVHHMATVHGSEPNRSEGRRMGYSITYVAPHVRHSGKRNSALLVHGVDRYRHFAADPVPNKEMEPDVLALVDGPFGGGVPVRARALRPDRDFYRNRQYQDDERQGR